MSEKRPMFTVRDPNDELVKCPFDDAHIILRSRIHYHLVRCRKKHPNSTKIVCPYDATEYLEPENFEAHLKECKRRDIILTVQNKVRTALQTKSHGDLSPAPFHMPLEKPDSSEMWDVDDNTASGSTSTSASSSASSSSASSPSPSPSPSPCQPMPPEVEALRNYLRKVYGKKAEPKKPLGRGAMLMKLLGRE